MATPEKTKGFLIVAGYQAQLVLFWHRLQLFQHSTTEPAEAFSAA
jgi:hypothetical protein